MKYGSRPAFPRPSFAPHDVGYEDIGMCEEQEGMSLREYAAVKCLAGLIAGGSVKLPYQEGHEQGPADAAALAVKFADALIVALDT